jgi:Holliday junction resolvasome RuvABC endonuclease subunit
MRLVGVDLSLTGTGIAVHEPGGLTFTRLVGEDGKKGAPLASRRARIRRLVAGIMEFAGTATAVAIESHDFGGRYGSLHDRSGAWWILVDELAQLGIPVIMMTPTQLKMYLANSGNASKQDVLVAAVKRWPTVDIRNDDQADAMSALSMLVRHLELAPLEDAWNQKMAKAMDGVDWTQVEGLR